MIALGLYTQPYSVFVAAAQVIWALGNPRVPRKARLLAFGALLVAGAGFLPWLAYARHNWPADVAPGVQATLQPRILLLVLRECAGGGYPLSVPVILAVLLGTRSGAPRSSIRSLLILMIVVPAGLALLVDDLFGYFVATRQVIFILPSVLLLAGCGVEYIAVKRGDFMAAIVALLLLAVSLVYDVRWFTRPREDWKTATTVFRLSIDAGACALLAPERTAQIFLFFDPGLLHHVYGESSDLSQCARVAVAVMPRAPRDSDAVAKRLADGGFRQSQLLFAGEPAVRLFSRPK